MKSLVRLLERWAERENIRTNGRAPLIPETTYRWAVNPIGGFHIVAEGDRDGAAWEMLNSRWARQVKSRAQRLDAMVRSG